MGIGNHANQVCFFDLRISLVLDVECSEVYTEIPVAVGDSDLDGTRSHSDGRIPQEVADLT